MLASVKEEIEIKIMPVKIRENTSGRRGDLVCFMEQVDNVIGDGNWVGGLAKSGKVIIFFYGLTGFIF